MTDRQRVTEDRFKTALAIGAQTHSRIVDQSAFGDRGIACAIWQLDRQRRRCPFAVLNIGDGSLLMNAFIVSFEIVKPDSAARGNRESSSFIRHTQAVARNDIAKRVPIVADW